MAKERGLAQPLRCAQSSLIMTETVYTIGHSTHPIDEFIKILQAYEIRLVVDVRIVPTSRHNPQFNQEELQQELQEHGIGYVHLKELGGHRRTSKSSINIAWRNLSFRGYADYMQSGEFRAGIEQLIRLAQTQRTVIMCSEAVPWRCHRSLIGDALLARGFQVVDIMAENSARPHKLTPWAKVDGVSITYPEISQESEAVDSDVRKRDHDIEGPG